jgi:hypothetical protein
VLPSMTPIVATTVVIPPMMRHAVRILTCMTARLTPTAVDRCWWRAQ